ncbi:MAG: tetratricopeptide repeat protein [Promethearchaeota archaeon]
MDILNFYIQVIEEVLLSNQEALDLVKILSVINTNIDTNIDRESIETCCKFPNVENSINELLATKLIKKKKGKESTYEFSIQEIQDVISSLTDENSHEIVLRYYEKKDKKFRGDLKDDIEILFHRAKISPSEELVNEFLTVANAIQQFDFDHKRLIDVAGELLILEEKYKAPILIVVGNILSVLGNPEDAERVYLNALDLYKDLAKKYYRIYLPYVAATQKNLGSVYIDSKRFEEAEKIYNDALSSYKELKKQYYNVHSPDFHPKEYGALESSYLDDIKAYNELLKKYYDIYLPEEPSITSELGKAGIDLDLLDDIQDGSIDSIESYKSLAKVSYDMYLIDIAKTQSNLGLVYSELRKFEDAERMHLKALKIKRKIADHYPNQVLPELVLTLLDLGDLYASLNKFENAEPIFYEALQISKRLAEEQPEVYLFNVALIQNSLGNVYARLQKYGQAEEIYLNALKIFKQFAKQDPKTYIFHVSEVQNNLGNLYLVIRKLDKAELYLNKAIKKDSTNLVILYNLACLESLKNNQASALELLKNIIKVDDSFIKSALSDDRFDNIRELKEFKELTSK